MNVNTVGNILNFCTRMLECGENFGGVRKSIPCLFECVDKLDSQSHSFSCLYIKTKVNIIVNYSDLLV